MREQHFADHALHRLLIAYVERVMRGLRALAGKLGGNRFEPLGVATGEGDRGAERRQLVRGAAADAGAASGDEHDAPGEQTGAERAAIVGGGHCG